MCDARPVGGACKDRSKTDLAHEQLGEIVLPRTESGVRMHQLALGGRAGCFLALGFLPAGFPGAGLPGLPGFAFALGFGLPTKSVGLLSAVRPRRSPRRALRDRKSVVEGKGGAVRVNVGGCLIIKQKKKQ